MDQLPMTYQNIQQQVNKVIEHSQHFTPITTTLMTDWYENKREFIEWFGGKLIHEFGNVEFHVEKDKQETLINDFLDQCGHIMDYDEWGNFYQFVKANAESFFQNLVTNEQLVFDRPIKKGMKLSKAFKYFIEDKELLIKIQQLASSYIQKDKVHGVLCFSVHPLDYLSASETTYNWRSCHSLDGEYRAGNLSYMTDKSTICCYIRGDNLEKLPNFPPDLQWVSKKWRMWIHLSDDWKYCALGRQYPFTLSGIQYEIQENLPGQWERFSDYHMKVIHDEKNAINMHLHGEYIPLNTYNGYELFNEKDVIKEGSKLNYNDILYSSYYKPFYSSKTWFDHNTFPKITIGHKVKCLCCNEEAITPGNGLMICDECGYRLGLIEEDRLICDCCGEYIDEDEAVYLHDGIVLCPECVQDRGVHYCENCDEFFYEEEMIYSNKYENWFCAHCFEDIYDEEMEYRKTNGLIDK